MSRIVLALALSVGAGFACVIWMREKGENAERPDMPSVLPFKSTCREAERESPQSKSVRPSGLTLSVPPSNRTEDEPGTGMSEASGGLQEDPESVRQVRAFRQETDRWTRERPVPVEDVERFSRQFAALPRERKMECLHRALNLIPDANVALLAGILFDKSQPHEILKATFNDIVNRSEEAKEPIVKAVYRDKTHPCCSDATWIYEVTGEKPE